MSKRVVIKLKGGMGNQMFQYAFGKTLAKIAENNGKHLTVLFDTTAYTDPNQKDTRRPYMLPLLNTNAVIADDDVALRARNPYGIISKIIRKIRHKLGIGNTAAYNPRFLRPPYKGYYEGYWQSDRYLSLVEDEIRKEFTLKKPMGAVAEEMHKQIAADPNAVSIFYRRTDYVGHSAFDIGEQAYQKRAIARMKELFPEGKLYVMSDDIDWVKEHADLPESSVFVSSDQIPPEEEMFLAAACRHNIIPNSTFAWWGAYLNTNPEKIVIAPKEWARGKVEKQYDYITPDEWLRV